LHGATEDNAAVYLLVDAIGDGLRSELRLTDLRDVDAQVGDGHLHHVGDLGAQLLDVLALLADHDARPRRVDRDIDLAGGTLDLNAAHRGIAELLLQEVAHHEIGVDVRRKVLGGCIPLRVPVASDAETNPDRIDFLTHTQPLLPSPTATEMWLLRLMMRAPRPLARARKRFSTGASSTMMACTLSSST